MAIEKSDDNAKTTATAANANAGKLSTTIFATFTTNENAIPAGQRKYWK